MYKLTKNGREKAESYIRELAAKRKEILDARLDTADDTHLPTVEDIESDINFTEIDEDGCYWNGWGVTDDYDSDYPISLELGKDFVDVEEEEKQWE